MIETITINNMGKNVSVELPSICPVCNKGIKPDIINCIATRIRPHTVNADVDTLEVLGKCPVCNNIIWAEYYMLPQIGYMLMSTYPPNDNIQIDIPQELNSLYPNFYKVYTQAAKAENSKLDEICGLGYRKAIEFLVKEYAIHKSPDDKQSVEAEALSKTVSRIDNKQIQDLARLITWLGNDHAHIKNKHPEYDIKSMRAFIRALANFIIFDYQAEEAAKIVGNSTGH